MFSGSRRSWIALAASLALAGLASPAFAQRAPARQAAAGRDAAPRQLYGQRQGASQAPAKSGGTALTRLPFVPVQKPGAPAAAQRRVVPGFQLNENDQAVVQLVLSKWEEKNAEIKRFSCKFTVWEYNDGIRLNPQAPKEPPKPRNGRLSYAAPDKGMYQVDPFPSKAGDDNSPPMGGEHWICDGKSIYEVKDAQKEIVERPLPEHMQGQAIADAPLPFVFGSTADKMQRRFWIRVSTPDRNFTPIRLEPGQVLLEAMPKTQQDAANFKLVQVIFLEQDMTIFAINEFLPNHTEQNEHRLSYVFQPPSINSPLERLKNLFLKPTNKLGYTLIVEKPPAAEERPAAPPGPSANSKSRGFQMPLRR